MGKLLVPVAVQEIETLLVRSPGIEVSHTGSSGRHLHFWRKLHDDAQYRYLAIGCKFKARTIKKSVHWQYEREVCEKCAQELIAAARGNR